MILLLSQISVLACIAFQDFKSRAISWYFIPVIFALGLFVGFSEYNSNDLFGSALLIEWGMSLVFLLFQFTIVYSYFAIKFKSFRLNFIDELLGLGDVLFLIAIIPFFSFRNYVLYYSMSLVFALLAHLISGVLIKSKNKKQKKHVEKEIKADEKSQRLIPLLGWMGLFFIGVFVYEYVNPAVN